VTTGAGNDTITASAGRGTLAGGAGDDVYYVDFTADPIADFQGDDPLMAPTIEDGLGNNSLYITSTDDFYGVSIGFGYTGTDSDLTLIDLGNGQDDYSHYVVINNWFNGTDYRPFTEIVVNGPDDWTRTFTADEIDSLWTPTAKDDVVDANNLLSVDGNVLVDNGNGVDTANVGSLQVTTGTFTTAQGGTVELNADGSFTYTGVSGFSGSDSFTYTETDSRSLLTASATVTISNIFDQPNRPPVAVDDILDAQGGLTAQGNVLTNDSDPDNNALSAPLQLIPTAHGSASILADGTVFYQANSGYRGSDSFTYTVEDSNGATATASVTVKNIFSNSAPVVVDDTAATDAQGFASGNVLTNDSDPEGDALTVVQDSFTTANGGTVVVGGNGDFTYQAASGNTDADSFDYTVLDAYGASSTGMVSIQNNVTVNQPPVAVSDVFDAQNTGTASGNVLTNDSDPNGDTLSTTAAALTTANGGQVTIAANGDVSYQAADGFRGSDGFDYTVNDGNGGTATGTVNIDNVFTNRAPVATADQFDAQGTGSASGNVLANDSDLDGDGLTATAQTLTTANGGSAMLMADGSFNYTAVHGFSGSDSFDYTVNDGNGGSATGTATISNIFADLPPVAATDSFTGPQDTALAGNVLADNGNGPDSDPEGDALTVTAQSVTTAQGGQVDIAANGDFTYTPASGYAGADSFSYTLNDAYGATATGEVDITLQATDHPPVATDDNFATVYSQPVYGNVLANDTDPDNDTLTVVQSSVTTQNGETISISADGNFAYTPPVDFLGTDSFAYTVTDGHGLTSSAMVTLSVAAPDGAIIGTSGDDNLNGTSHPDTLLGLAGNDRLEGGSNNDLIYGGSGDDDLKGGSGDDYSLYGETGNDTLEGGSGNDALYGGDGNDILTGGSGSDNLDGGNGDDYLDGGSDNDMMFGGAGNDTLIGGSGDDYIDGGSGADMTTGGSGNDTYIVDNIGDTVSENGGSGTDTVQSNVSFTLTDGVENLTLTGFADLNGTGNTLDNLLIANTGNDTLAGAGGNDTYVFGRDMGQDAIYNGISSSNTAAGTLAFGTGITSDQLWLDRVDDSGNISATGNNLRIDIMGTASSMTVMGEFDATNAYKQLSQLTLSDSGLHLDAQLANLVQAMASFESDYYTANGIDFDPTATGNAAITDSTVLSAVSSDWHS
jgi:Ca2+-binding RTX toxin-like protein